MRDYVALAVRELDKAGIPWEIEIGKRHNKLLYKVGDRVVVIGIAGSPSDMRAARNLKSQVRNSIRNRAA